MAIVCIGFSLFVYFYFFLRMSLSDSPLYTRMTSASSQVLSTYELLQMIFKELDPTGLRRPTYVCKLWSDICLDTWWKEIHCLHVLFELLGDMCMLADGTLVSSYLLHHECWIYGELLDVVIL
jgi:hypothetical protein